MKMSITPKGDSYAYEFCVRINWRHPSHPVKKDVFGKRIWQG